MTSYNKFCKTGSVWLILALVIGMSVMLVNCVTSPTAGSANNAGNNQIAQIPEDVFIDLPSSISYSSTTGSGKRLNGNTSDDPIETAKEIYNWIREYVYIADEVVNNSEWGVKTQILFWKEAIDWTIVENLGSLTWEDTTEAITIVAAYSAANELHYQLKLSKSDVLALKIDFNGDFNLPKGQAYYYIDALDSTATTNGKVLVNFEKKLDGSDTLRILTVNVTSDQPPTTDPDGPQNFTISMKEKNGIVHLAGGSYHPNVDSILPAGQDEVGYCYNYKARVDTLANRAIVDLGLPPATYADNDTSLFTTYGIHNAFGNRIINWDVPALPDSVKSWIATSYKDSVSVDSLAIKLMNGSLSALRPASDVDNMTLTDLNYFLELNKDIPDSSDKSEVRALLFVTNLTQPVYFDKDGYVANGETVPSLFTDLDDVTFLLDAIVPNAVTTLTISEQ